MLPDVTSIVIPVSMVRSGKYWTLLVVLQSLCHTRAEAVLHYLQKERGKLVPPTDADYSVVCAVIRKYILPVIEPKAYTHDYHFRGVLGCQKLM